MAQSSRNGHSGGPVSTQFASPDPELARAEQLVEDGTARHLDDKKHIEHLADVDARDDRHRHLMLQCVQHIESALEQRTKSLRQMRTEMDQLFDQLDVDRTAVEVVRRLLERREAIDPEHDGALKDQFVGRLPDNGAAAPPRERRCQH